MDKLQEFNCQLHKKRKATYLYISMEDINLFKCSHCLVEQSIQPQNLISLQDALDIQDSNKIINNWPPNLSQKLLNSLSEVVSSKLQLKILEELNKFFDGFQNDVISLLQSIKKTFILHVNKLNNIEESTRQSYNDISQVKKLQQIINNKESNQNEISSELKAFFSEMIQISEQNKEELQKSFISFDTEYKKIKIDELKGIKDMVLSLLNKITIKEKEIKEENNIDNSEEQQLQQQPNENNLMKIKDNEVLIFQDIIDVSFSIFKNYNQDINQQKEQFQNLQDQFKKLKQQLQDNQKNMQLDQQVKENDIDELRTKFGQSRDEFSLIIKDKKDFNIHKNIQLLLEQQFNKQERSNSQYIINKLYEDNSLFNQLKIEQLIKNYPIFDINNPKKIIPIKFSLLPYKDEQNIPSILYNQLKIQQYKHILNTYNKNFTVKSNFQFNHNKKYVIRFKFNKYFYKMTTIQIGLIQTNQLNQNDSFIYYLSPTVQNYTNQQIKGNTFNSNQAAQHEEINELEMRVSINQNILIFTDFPYYKNVNKATINYDQTLNWYLGIYTQGKANKVITIQEILEVDEFTKLN